MISDGHVPMSPIKDWISSREFIYAIFPILKMIRNTDSPSNKKLHLHASIALRVMLEREESESDSDS